MHKALKGFPRGRAIVKNAEEMLKAVDKARESSGEVATKCEDFFSLGDKFSEAAIALNKEAELGVIGKKGFAKMLHLDKMDGLLSMLTRSFFACIFDGQEAFGIHVSDWKAKFSTLCKCKALLQVHADSDHLPLVEEMLQVVNFVTVFNKIKETREIDSHVTADIILSACGNQWTVLNAWLEKADNVL